MPQYLEQRDCSFYCWLRGIAFEKLIEAHRRHILSGRRSVLQEARGTARLSDESEILLAEQFLASGTSPSGAGADNLVKLWDSTTQARLFELSGHEATVICLAFAPDNQILASGSTDGTVRLWNRHTGEIDSTLTFHGIDPFEPVASLAFSVDGATLAAGSLGSGVFVLWDVASKKLIATCAGHSGPVFDLAFSLDGQFLATGSYDKQIKLWKAEQFRTSVAKFEATDFSGHRGDVRSIAFVNDSRAIISVGIDLRVHLWDFVHGRDTELLGHVAGINTVAISPNGSTFATAGSDATVLLWDIPSADDLDLLASQPNTPTPYVTSLDFSPDGATLLSSCVDHLVTLWNLDTGHYEQLEGHDRSIWGTAISRDGRLLATGDLGGTVRIWDVEKRTQLAQFTRHRDTVLTTAFTPDGRTLASAGGHGEVRIWDVRMRKETRAFDYFIGETIHSSAFSPDGALLLLGCGDGSVRSIELATGDEGPIFGGHQGIIREIVFATDEKLFATASSDGTARLWELRSGRIVQTFEGHTSGVNAGVFMPGGKRIATAGADNTVRVWDRETGEELLLLQHTSRLWSLACSPDGTLLAAGDEDKKIRLWRAPRID